ncbi:hypothetical protein HIM_08583 [Hirsutella minnesotensis 3608]|uniref:54S ribosomal protein L24 n=1 Tax=Hirsutella minnesotensis 3608 TaxID=1043627 RepID=A0A0F7ZY83_9HYPO|nr:hypothetical protein HIM_08583 [Hirsutella minnesotensis 3608]
MGSVGSIDESECQKSGLTAEIYFVTTNDIGPISAIQKLWPIPLVARVPPRPTPPLSPGAAQPRAWHDAAAGGPEPDASRIDVVGLGPQLLLPVRAGRSGNCLPRGQANRGLYGSARIRFGNVVAEKHNNKSHRFWRPNVHVKIFKSPAFGAKVKTRLTIRVLKTIRNEGGLENYLLKNKPARIKELGPGGWNLRWLLMQTKAVQQRFNDERIALGLPPKEIEDRDDIIKYALDFATPGPLSVRSRAILDEMRAATTDAFVLGDESMADVEGVQELSDEAEEAMMKQLDNEVGGSEQAAESRPAPTM